jgi:hypothetical protein
MTEYQRLRKKWEEAVRRGQIDLAQEYFQATLEAGAKEMDAIIPGYGDAWRRVGKAMTAALDAVLLGN